MRLLDFNRDVDHGARVTIHWPEANRFFFQTIQYIIVYFLLFNLTYGWGACGLPNPLAKPGGCAPRTSCETRVLRPPDSLKYRAAAPPGPPAKMGGCAPQTPC